MNGAQAYDGRRRLADHLRRRRDPTAEQVTEAFLERHPAWVAKYGEGARIHGVQDARFHVDFLAAAIEVGSLEAFRDYARWCARMLGSRGIEPVYLAENLEQIREALAHDLDDAGRAWVEQMVAAARAVALDSSEVEAGEVEAGEVEAGEVEAGQVSVPGSPARGALAGERGRYREAALTGHRATALTVALECVKRGLSVPEVYHGLLQPVQYEIGVLWETNEISVAQEHMATAITQYVIAQLYSRLEIPAERRGRAVVTGVEGELHQVGASMLADVLESAGWDVRYLGTQLPHRNILQVVEAHEPDVLAISATMLYSLPRVAALTADVRRRFGTDVRVVVGGGAFRASPGAWRELGADGYGRDLRDAVRVIESLRDAVG